MQEGAISQGCRHGRVPVGGIQLERFAGKGGERPKPPPAVKRQDLLHFTSNAILCGIFRDSKAFLTFPRDFAEPNSVDRGVITARPVFRKPPSRAKHRSTDANW